MKYRWNNNYEIIKRNERGEEKQMDETNLSDMLSSLIISKIKSLESGSQKLSKRIRIDVKGVFNWCELQKLVLTNVKDEEK